MTTASVQDLHRATKQLRRAAKLVKNGKVEVDSSKKKWVSPSKKERRVEYRRKAYCGLRAEDDIKLPICRNGKLSKKGVRAANSRCKMIKAYSSPKHSTRAAAEKYCEVMNMLERAVEKM